MYLYKMCQAVEMERGPLQSRTHTTAACERVDGSAKVSINARPICLRKRACMCVCVCAHLHLPRTVAIDAMHIQRQFHAGKVGRFFYDRHKNTAYGLINGQIS